MSDTDTAAIRVDPYVTHEGVFAFHVGQGSLRLLTTAQAAQLVVDILNVTTPRGEPGLLQAPRERVISLQVQEELDARVHDLPVVEYTERDPWGAQHVRIRIGRHFFLRGYRDAQRNIRNALGVENCLH